MDKDTAIGALGGIEQAALWMGLSAKLVKEWSPRLHPAMSDRCIAAMIRKAHAKARNLSAKQWYLDPANEAHLWWTLGSVSLAAMYAAGQHEVPPIFASQHPANDITEKERRRPARIKRSPEPQEVDPAAA